MSEPNLTPGQTIPNMVLVPLCRNNTVTIYNSFGTVDVIADLVGSYAPGTGAGFTGAPPPAYWTPGSPTASPHPQV